MTIQAINAKHQRLVNKVYKASRKYHDLVNSEAHCLEVTEAMYSAQEKAFDKFFVLAADLPQREIKNFDKQYNAIHGYTAIN